MIDFRTAVSTGRQTGADRAEALGDPMGRIRVRLLGGFEAALADGRPAAFESRKTEALLALLACRPDEALSRDAICGTLWGDRGERQARHSLSQALSALRRALPSSRPLLNATRDTVGLAADAVDVDVTAFSRLVAQGGRPALRQAASLYRGALLEGFPLREGAFEEWLAGERMRLAERAGGALLRLAEDEIAAQDHAAALAALTRALELDPLSEEAHRRLIRLHMDQERYNLAIQQYRACEAIVRRELGAAPEPSTAALHLESLRRAAATPEPSTAALHLESLRRAAATPAPSAPTGEAKPAAAIAGQRKSVSVLCATFFMRGGAGAASDLEETRDRLAPLLARVAEATRSRGGSIVGRAADGMTAVFGIPAALEDHAARACQAAADIAAMASEAPAGAARLSVAVDSGDVVLHGSESTAPRRDELHGDCLRRAEWLAGCGGIGGIGVTGATARLAERYWRFRPLTEIRFAMDDRPLPLFRPVSRHVGHDGFSHFLGRRLSPFVGRHAEMEVLRGASSRAAAGQGQLVAAVGHPGVGKSRLLHELLQSIADGWQILTCRGDPQFADTAYLPIAGLVRDCCGIADDVPRGQLGDAIRKAAGALGAAGDAMVPALTSLLGVESADPAWRDLEPRLKRRRIADCVRAVLRRQAAERPLVIAMEDLHWLDAASRRSSTTSSRCWRPRGFCSSSTIARRLPTPGQAAASTTRSRSVPWRSGRPPN
jgi:DNA-binding SARP family transcriptional activator